MNIVSPVCPKSRFEKPAALLTPLAARGKLARPLAATERLIDLIMLLGRRIGGRVSSAFKASMVRYLHSAPKLLARCGTPVAPVTLFPTRVFVLTARSGARFASRTGRGA